MLGRVFFLPAGTMSRRLSIDLETKLARGGRMNRSRNKPFLPRISHHSALVSDTMYNRRGKNRTSVPSSRQADRRHELRSTVSRRRPWARRLQRHPSKRRPSTSRPQLVHTVSRCSLTLLMEIWLPAGRAASPSPCSHIPETKPSGGRIDTPGRKGMSPMKTKGHTYFFFDAAALIIGKQLFLPPGDE